MNRQERRIAGLLLKHQSAKARTLGFVDIADQTELLAEGYDLRALNKDLEIAQETL